MFTETEQIVMTQEDCKKLEKFFRQVNNASNRQPIQMLPLDEPLKGLKGVIAFPQEEFKNCEASILFSWKFAEPIQDIYDVTDRAEELLKDCLSNQDWSRCDDVNKLKVGFANHSMSKCRYFHLRTIKGMSKEVQQAFSQADKNMQDLLG